MKFLNHSTVYLLLPPKVCVTYVLAVLPSVVLADKDNICSTFWSHCTPKTNLVNYCKMHLLMAHDLESRLDSASHFYFHHFQARIYDNAALSQYPGYGPGIHCKINPQRTPWNCQPNVRPWSGINHHHTV